MKKITVCQEFVLSPIGHSIVGLSFAAAAMPSHWTKRNIAVTCLAFVALANVPDWPLPQWGHERYDISHSVFVNLFLISITLGLLIVWLKRYPNVSLPKAIIGCSIFAWLSHLLLDSFYNHGKGVAIFWPFSDARLNLPIPIFGNMDLSVSILDQHNLSVFLVEAFAYSPLLLAVLWFRRKALFRNETSLNRTADGKNHSP